MKLDESGLVEWGARIGETIATPAFIGLQGRLGAGKSVLARAIGRGAGVEQPMPSPTFTLVNRYDTGGRREVVHLDLFRLVAPAELDELGWSELGAEDEIVLVEWPDRAQGLMPEDHWLIELTVPADEPDRRDVEVHRVGAPPELAAFPLSISSA